MCLIGNNWTRPFNNYNSHSMGNWENLDSILDNIKFIINFLRHNNNVMVMYTDKSCMPKYLQLKYYICNLLSKVQSKKKKSHLRIEREKTNTVKC